MIRNVLIVDDDREMLTALKEGLAKYEDTFAVLTAEDGREAMERLQETTLSLVVTDLKMPRVDGFGLLQHVMQTYPDVPVIVMTAYSTPKMEKLALEGGAVGYIAKPFMLESLAKKIMATLRQESEGGTLHSVSSGIFLQLMEMEQKTCTIRLEDKSSGKKGVLFFRDGELLDARVNHLQGKPAAYQIFSWDKVSISIQNVCPPIENKIQSELQTLILDATRLKDENAPLEDPAQKPRETTQEPIAAERPKDPLKRIRQRIESRIGSAAGVEDIDFDNSWKGLTEQFSGLGVFFQTGPLKLFCVNRGEDFDHIVICGPKPIVVRMNPKSPREKIFQALWSKA